MTSRERLLTALQLQKPDRVPVAPFINPGWLNQAEVTLRERLLKECDPFIETGVGVGLGMALGAAAADICRSWNEPGCHVSVIETPKGELRSVTAITDKMHCTTEFYFKSPDDVEKFLSVPYKPVEVDASIYYRTVKEYGDEALILASCMDAVCIPGFWFSPEDFMLHCLENFEMIKLLLDTTQNRLLDYVRTCKQAGVHNFRICGAELASQTLMHPSWFPKLVLPYDAELHAEIRRDGGIAYMHCHGKISDILEQIADTGPTALDPLEAAPGGNLTLADAKQRIGNRVCLVGNLDDLEFIGSRSRKAVFEAGLACIEAAGPDGYILAGTASGIYTPQVAEGFITLAEASRSAS